MTFSYSVVIPAYNAAATIGQAVQSILDQTVRPQEIMVVDDGSTDGTAAAVAGMGSDITVISQDNRGPGGATTAAWRRESSTSTPPSASTETSSSRPTRRSSLVKTPGPRQVRRDRRSGRAPRRRPPQGRPDGARHRRPARRARARTSASAVFAAGEAAQEARDAGADLVGADDLAEQIQKGDARLRRGHRHPRPHAHGRPPRPGLGPRGLMPNPKTGHRHHRRGPRRVRVQGRPGRVPHRPLRQRARPHRQGQLRRGAARDQLPGRARRAAAGQAGCGQGQVPARRSPSSRRWVPASRSTPTACARRRPA